MEGLLALANGHVRGGGERLGLVGVDRPGTVLHDGNYVEGLVRSCTRL